MGRYNSLHFLLSRRVLAILIFLGFIPVVGTMLAYCPWLQWIWQ